MLPASIAVAPNSPKALAKERTPPDTSPGKALGRMIRQNIIQSVIPKERPASHRPGSICSRAALADLYISGKETTVAVMTVAIHVKAICRPNCSTKNLPTRRLVPRMYNSKNPTTVGGSTRGRVKIPSAIILTTSLFCCRTHHAVRVPRKNTMMMVVMAVCREIHRGDQFIEVASIVHLRFYIVKSILHHQSSICKRTAYFS